MKEICKITDLVENSGVAALLIDHINEQQIALFYLPDTDQQVFAIGNWDPCGKANVLSRGMVGSIGEELVVASPLYKQHFSLSTGQCLEESDKSVPTYPIIIKDSSVCLAT